MLYGLKVFFICASPFRTPIDLIKKKKRGTGITEP